ncbi:hypothetical protein BRADI_2g30475v3 [Brachypodium distachyon]|uniref:Uncharacterized protein n=1 Tax=Brachypodium distachyon TaxID=15368 RepID=A0A2K2DB92_BRADI|nr:hypothetical protein BRADI_2g30475v3 [Brachypodium distachyon]
MADDTLDASPAATPVAAETSAPARTPVPVDRLPCPLATEGVVRALDSLSPVGRSHPFPRLGRFWQDGGMGRAL